MTVSPTEVTDVAGDILAFVYSKYGTTDQQVIKAALTVAATAVEQSITAEAVRVALYQTLNRK